MRPQNWQVLIVEDDPEVAAVYRRTVTSIGNLEVAGTVTRSEDAMMFMRRRHVDLLLLDVHLAGGNGVSLLQQLRGTGHPVEVIATTACRDAKVVRAILQRGAIDYLVKPFQIDRLRQALGRFLVRANALRNPALDQAAVDQACAAGRQSKRWLPKGLTQDGVDAVTATINANNGPQSAATVAEVTGLARVTARRYLEYLVATDQASVESPPTGPGRPRKLYRTAT
jgi:two-component system response regulator DctR